MLGIKIVIKKTMNDRGELYDSELVIKNKKKGIRPNCLMHDLDRLHLNDVLYLERGVDTFNDPYINIKGESYTGGKKFYLINRYNNKTANVFKNPTIKEIDNILTFFKEIQEEFLKITRGLESTTRTYNF